MLYYENNEYFICKHRVKYKDEKDSLENYVGVEGKSWWEELAQKHKHIEISSYIDIVPTNKQLSRLEEVNDLNLNDGFSSIVSDYVIQNKFPNTINHPLKNLEIKKSREEQEPYIMDLDFRVSMTELGI